MTVLMYVDDIVVVSHSQHHTNIFKNALLTKVRKVKDWIPSSRLLLSGHIPG